MIKTKTNLPSLESLVLISVPAILILINLYFYFLNSRYVSTDNSYIKIGISSPSAQINGIISEVKVKNTQIVKKGGVIITIDKTSFEINVKSAEANLMNVNNQIQNLKSGYLAQLAQIESAKTDLNYYQKQYDRVKSLNYILIVLIRRCSLQQKC